MYNKITKLLTLMLLFGTALVCLADEQSVDGDSEFNEDSEFYDAQDQKLTFNEKMASIQAMMQVQYPARDEYTGYNMSLDKERAKVIARIFDCYRQIFVFSKKVDAYQSELIHLKKRYNKLQEKRADAKRQKEERKNLDVFDSSSSEDIGKRYPQDFDSDDDFPDYESHSSQKTRSSVRSGMRSGHAPSNNQSYFYSSDW